MRIGPQSHRRDVFCKGSGATPPGWRKTPGRRGPLSLLVLASVLLAAGSAAAESWTLIWSEDFTDITDWHLEAHYHNDAGGLQNQLSVFPNTETATWLGPTFRTAAGSVWDDSTYDILRIEIRNLTFAAVGSENRQWGFVLQDSGANHIPDATDAISDWFELKVIDATCCGVLEWAVVVKDDGLAQTGQHFTIADPTDKQLYANITINTMLERFWINWSTQTASGAHTGTWTGDGPFAESNANLLKVWGYSSFAGTSMAIDQIDLYGNQTAVAPPPPPPPPPKRDRIHADFGYATSELGTQFYDRSEGPGEMVKWSWSFGDGYGSEREHPFHSFMCRGNFTIVLEVVDEFGNNGTVSARVQINETKPLCGVVTKGEEGIAVNSPYGLIGIPTGIFIIIAAVSAASLALRVEIPYYPRGLRLLLLFISVVGLFFTLGFAGQLIVALGG